MKTKKQSKLKVALIIMNTSEYEEYTIEDNINYKLSEIQADSKNEIVEVKVVATSNSVVISILYKAS